MKGNSYKIKTETFDKKHRHYSGLIFLSDFNTNYRGAANKAGSSIAARIESDLIREIKYCKK